MIEEMNFYGSKGIPFLFIIDFEMRSPVIIPLEEVDGREILYSINGLCNCELKGGLGPAAIPAQMRKFPISYKRYKSKFDYVVNRQRQGDSYLVNLTYPTRIETDLTFREIFFRSREKYRLLFRDRFLVFSPESFVRIRGREISSYPMKGTIDASVPGAEKKILNDEKEFAEHLTIVDLIRNDLNMVACNVSVERFRYIERVRTVGRDLLQVSSKITGVLDADYRSRLGQIISVLLPAGSVTGAPKKMTVDIIREAEKYDRGYYTGVFGCFTGDSLDSAVMIRFMERNGNEIYYKSGGGITVYSDPALEYRELVDKVYVPAV